MLTAAHGARAPDPARPAGRIALHHRRAPLPAASGQGRNCRRRGRGPGHRQHRCRTRRCARKTSSTGIPAQSPYLGRHLRGRISRTLLRGQTIYKDGRDRRPARRAVAAPGGKSVPVPRGRARDVFPPRRGPPQRSLRLDAHQRPRAPRVVDARRHRARRAARLERCDVLHDDLARDGRAVLPVPRRTAPRRRRGRADDDREAGCTFMSWAARLRSTTRRSGGVAPVGGRLCLPAAWHGIRVSRPRRDGGKPPDLRKSLSAARREPCRAEVLCRPRAARWRARRFWAIRRRCCRCCCRTCPRSTWR